MKTTTLHVEDEIAIRRAATGLTWLQIVLLGIETAEKNNARQVENSTDAGLQN